MSQENVEIVRRAIDANRSGPPDQTVAVAVTLADPDFEFRSRLTSVEGATYRGHDGVRTYFRDMADAWQQWHIEVAEITAVRPNAVLADVTFRAIGKSGVDVELGSSAVWVLSSGRIVELHAYPSQEEALEAAGLSE